MTAAVDELVARLWPGRSARVEPLLGGITNANYLVDLGDEQVVLRVSGEHTDLLGINRRHETAANDLASSIGVAPDVILFLEDQNVLVTRFLPGRPIPPDELGREPMLGAVASTLRRLHNAGSIDSVFDPFSIVRTYHETASARGVDEPFDFTAATNVLDRISAARPFRATAFCHNDFLNGNFIFDGEVRVVDWEYAGMGDPFFDLANLSVNHGFDAAADEGLLAGYFGRSDEPLLATLSLMKLVSEMRETMWGVVQMAVSTLDFDYATYCRER
ncbi:MAG TPA: choline/ethanolamine kinase family protein, partial [Acidimicrobiales bacterium]